jgi:hypothetical protein
LALDNQLSSSAAHWGETSTSGRNKFCAFTLSLRLFISFFFFSSSSSRVNLMLEKRREEEDRGIGGSSITVVIVKIGPKNV